MERVLSSELGSHVGERVTLAGWVHHQRHLANVSFLLLRDAGGVAQIVVDDGSTAVLVAESVVAVEGIVVAAAQAPGGFELHQPTVTVLSATATAPPFELRRRQLNAQLPTLLDHAAVSLRHPPIRAAL